MFAKREREVSVTAAAGFAPPDAGSTMDPASVPSNAADVSADTIMAAAHHFRQRGGELATDAGGMVAAAMAADKEWRAAAAVDASLPAGFPRVEDLCGNLRGVIRALGVASHDE